MGRRASPCAPTSTPISSAHLRFVVGDYTRLSRPGGAQAAAQPHQGDWVHDRTRVIDLINLRGIKFFPVQIEEAVRAVSGTGDEFQIRLSTFDSGLDVMTVVVEHTDSAAGEAVASEVRTRCEYPRRRRDRRPRHPPQDGDEGQAGGRPAREVGEGPPPAPSAGSEACSRGRTLVQSGWSLSAQENHDRAVPPDLFPQLPDSVARPSYLDREPRVGIAHIGVGNFHRSHQAMYVDRVLNRDPGCPDGRIPWNRCARGGAAGLLDALRSQDGLYSLSLFESDGAVTSRVIGSLPRQFALVPDDPAAAVARSPIPAHPDREHDHHGQR